MYHVLQGPVTFRVQVPNFLDKSEWRLNGQTFNVTLPLTDSVSVLKAKIFDDTGMQAGKQKLQLEVIYNILLFSFFCVAVLFLIIERI